MRSGRSRPAWTGCAVTRFLLRRSGQALVVLLLVTIIVFGLSRLLPGGPARAILGVHATPSNIAAFNRETLLAKHKVKRALIPLILALR